MQRSDHPAGRPAATRSFRPAAALLAGTLVASSALAQEAPELPAASPKARVEQRVGVTDLAVEYSSPGAKGRAIWGGLVPWNELWRTGANAATKLTVSRDFTFGGKPVPAGSYALYTIPGEQSWTVILNTNAEASGTSGYDEKKDVARVSVTPAEAPARERMTFLFSETTDDATRLDLEWAGLRVAVPIGVDTSAHVKANIDDALADAWRPHFASARWLLEQGGDLAQALSYAETSVAIRPTWWNQWVRAQILGKQDRRADAVAAAKEARQLGKGDRVFEQFFAPAVDKAVADWNAGR